MQPPRQSNSTAAVIAAVALGSGILGAVCGAFITYSVMSVGRLSTQVVHVPQAAGFGHPVSHELAGGWMAYDFPDLQLSVELPCAVTPYRRVFPASSTWQVVKTADYVGGHIVSVRIGAFWSQVPVPRSAEEIMKWNMKQPEARLGSVEYTINRSTVDGSDAAVLHGSYVDSGRHGGLWEVYITRGTALYNLEISYWSSDEAQAAKDWTRVLGSLHFHR